MYLLSYAHLLAAHGILRGIFMLEFKPLTLEDKALFDSYIIPYKFLTCEYSFLTLFIWRKALDITFCIYKNALIIKRKFDEASYYFMQPIGYKREELEEILDEMIKYKTKNEMEFLFKAVEKPFLDELMAIKKYDLICTAEEDNFDYIYKSETLINLSGRKLAGKRNHISKFISNYNYKIEDINDKNTEKCIEVSRKWCELNGNTPMIKYEHEAIVEMLNNREKLNFIGIVVYVNDKPSAFTIGEIMNSDMAIIHVEKAFSEINGLYSFINKTFAELHLKGIKYINREEDMGLDGLRKAKQSYQPIKLEYKYSAKMR